MVETTKALVDRFQAKVGYTQSDEITLVWHVECDSSSEYPFDGRFQKMESLLAAFATAVPGMLLQLVLIPPLVLALKKAGLVPNGA